MKKLISFITCLLLLASLAVGCGQEAEPDGVGTFSVGYARADISPTASVPMGGWSDIRYSTMTTDPLYTICIAFSDKDTTVLVFTLDLTQSYNEVIPDIRAYVAEQTGIPMSNIVTTASHTHSGPDLAEQSYPAIAEYTQMLKEQMLAAAKAALEDRKPAQMLTAFCRPESMNYVRHYILDDGTYAGSNFGDFSAGKIIGHRGNADNLLQLVKFTREGGRDVVLVNWQGHYRMEKGTLISSDYYGVIRDTLERELDCEAAFILGPSGNVNTRSMISTEPSILDYREYGQTLGQYAVEAAKSFCSVQTGKVEITENLYQGVSIKGGTKEVPMYALSLGDVAFIFAPYEMFDTNGITIRNSSKYHATIIATCSNSRMYYVPDQIAYDYNSYEAGTAQVVAGSGELLADEYITMLNDLYTRTGITPTAKVADYDTPAFEPVSDGEVYTNLKPGDTSAYTATQCGAYQITLRGPNGVNKMLVWGEDVRDQILNTKTMKLLFDDSNIIVGIAE